MGPSPSARDPGFQILHEDDAVLAVVKPSGIATQAPPGIESLEVRIKTYLTPDAELASVYLGIPHRLDRPVSGAMVFAKTRRAARQLARQFERRQVRKLYWACVERAVEPASGTWIDYLHKVYGHPRTAIVEHTHPGAGGHLALPHAGLRTAAEAGWKSSWKRAAPTRFARKPRPAATPCWATRTTAAASHSARNSKTSACARSPYTPAAWCSRIRTPSPKSCSKPPCPQPGKHWNGPNGTRADSIIAQKISAGC